MSLLSSHLEQISFSSQSIASLPFPPPKIFTNALLAPHDITALIRDTEPHERALFSVPPPPPRDTTSYPDPDLAKKTKRRQTVFNVAGGEITSSAATASRAPRHNTAVAAVLGTELNEGIRRTEQGIGRDGRGELDAEVLLRGAEKLGEVYHMDGAKERIMQARRRRERVEKGLRFYEEKVGRQQRELERMQRAGEEQDEDMMDWDQELEPEQMEVDEIDIDELISMEEEEIRELERKKRELEERVSGMERDLGGLLR